MEIVAYDSFYMNDRATATVSVSVNRNPDSPAFRDNNGNNYFKSIDEMHEVGTVVLRLNATDTDGVCFMDNFCYINQFKQHFDIQQAYGNK
jgi:hypothetical protein